MELPSLLEFAVRVISLYICITSELLRNTEILCDRVVSCFFKRFCIVVCNFLGRMKNP